ncbi:sugar transferase [Propioniciclava soli]|uniref:sugar transferase n=1 Tax=Propioniciclava soli TaxID=2775081 RepID=UPI001E33792A|nr:sugar transferase [Propioniciclava soli]
MTTASVRGRSAQSRWLRQLDARLLWPSKALRKSALAAIDLIIIAISVTLAAVGRFGMDLYIHTVSGEVTGWHYASIAAGWLVALWVMGSYGLQLLQSGTDEYRRVISASALLFGVIGTFCYLTQNDFARGFFLLLFIVGVPLLLLGRFLRRQVMNNVRRRGMLQSPIIVAGSPTSVDEIANVLRRERWLGYRVVGALTADAVDETPAGLPVLGRVDDVANIVRGTDMYGVVFTEGAFPEGSNSFRRTAWQLEQMDVEMMVVPAMTDISAERITPRPIAGLPLVMIDRPQAQQAGRWVKRLFDVVGSALFLLLASPILALVALAVKIEDGGPVLFSQVRVGRNGELFNCLKIRSMVVDAEARKAELMKQNQGAGVLFKMAKDPRITKVGSFIRRFSIDEVPQFWNVLRGDMSLVGPRPALPTEVARYDQDTSRRLDVRPGLTGLWQVSGRSNLSWEETVRLDLYYVDNWCFMQDVTIMARTAKAVLGSSGAY